MKSFDFHFDLTLDHADNLSKTLQNYEITACSSKRNSELTVSVLQSMRRQDYFNQFYDITIKKAKGHIFIKDQTVPRRRKAPEYSILQYVRGHSSKDPEHHPETNLIKIPSELFFMKPSTQLNLENSIKV